MNQKRQHLPILIWLEKLPMPVREKAINNFFAEENNIYDITDTCPSMEIALHVSFQWHKTPEGFLFWKATADKYEEG